MALTGCPTALLKPAGMLEPAGPEILEGGLPPHRSPQDLRPGNTALVAGGSSRRAAEGHLREWVAGIESEEPSSRQAHVVSSRERSRLSTANPPP